MILDTVTLKQGKMHSGGGLITDAMAYVVTDADEDIKQYQPFGAESTEIHVSLMTSTGFECC